MVSKTTKTREDRNKRVPLATNIMYRSFVRGKDARLENCFQESIKDDVTDSTRTFVVKRPGLSLAYSFAEGEGRGLAYFKNHLYTVIGDKLYRDEDEIFELETDTSAVGFCEFDNEGISYLFLCDGLNGYVIHNDGEVEDVGAPVTAWQSSTDYDVGDVRRPNVPNGFSYIVIEDDGSSGTSPPDWPTVLGTTVEDNDIVWRCHAKLGGFPSPHVPTPQFIDGYMLLPRANSQDIHNSAVDNIFSWSAEDFVTAEIFPDKVKSLSRQNNQILALGEYSGEFLYNAGIANGSPLARNDATVLQIGVACPYAVFQDEKFCIFVGQSNSGGRAVWMLDGFQPKKISTEAIERSLDHQGSLNEVRGYGLRVKGHFFYLIRLNNISLVYDIEEKVWHVWKSGDNSTFSGMAKADSLLGYNYILHATDGLVYTLDQEIYTDDEEDIVMKVFTSKIDNGNMNRKFMRNLNIVGDLIIPEDEVGPQYFYIRWTDDDYETWKPTQYRRTDAWPRSFVTNLGSFRRRAFEIKYTGNTDCRLEYIEFELDQGEN